MTDWTFPYYNATDFEMIARCHAYAKLHNSGGGTRVFAMAVDKRGVVLAQRGNTYTKSHPKQARWSFLAKQPERTFLHAEAATVLAALKTRKDIYKLYVVRVDSTGKMKDSKPCPVCQLMLDTEFPHVIVVYGREK